MRIWDLQDRTLEFKPQGPLGTPAGTPTSGGKTSSPSLTPCLFQSSFAWNTFYLLSSLIDMFCNPRLVETAKQKKANNDCLV